MKRNLFVLALVTLLLLSAAACGGPAPVAETPTETSATPAPVETPTEAPEQEGEQVMTILSMGPSNTEILVALGLEAQIVGVDSFSEGIPGIAPDLPLFDMLTPDIEAILALAPDMIVATGMTQVDGVDPFHAVAGMGIQVVHIPASVSIAGIQTDIRFIAAQVGAEVAGEAIIAEMQWEIDELLALVEGVAEPRTVYFEIAAPPFMYSFGHGVFLHEMIELIGAVNVFADQDAWFFVADEAVLEANPDVILTNVSYLDNPVEDILTRHGWGAVSAVADGRVYFIDPDSSSRPSHHIVRALWEMVRAVHPELFG